MVGCVVPLRGPLFNMRPERPAAAAQVVARECGGTGMRVAWTARRIRMTRMSPIERHGRGGSAGDGSMSDDGQTVSPWMQGPRFPGSGPLDRTMHADVCVVGAGIAGTMVAWQLLLEGKSVVVLEAGGAGGGETSRTTAHLTHVLDA